MMTTSLPSQYSSLAERRLLVTGAGGFIGGALVRRLAGYGLDVTGTVLEEEEARELGAERIDARVLDLSSSEPWDELVSGYDIVFNVAARFQETEFGESDYDRVNHLGALKLAETASRVGVGRFVQCSTVGVHGDVRRIPATEETPFNPMDLYHRTKLAGELAILEFGRSLGESGMIVTVNRPAMVYGPGDLRMLKLFKTILDGSFRMIGSGKVLAHLGYIEDQTDAFLASAVAPRAAAHLEAVNIASGEPLSLNELASLIASEGGVRLSRLKIPVAPVWLAGLVCEILWKPTGRRPPLFRRRVGFFTHNRAFDLTKARKVLGFESGWSHQDGIRETIRWYRKEGLV